MSVPLERPIKVEPATHAQKGRFRIKQRKEAVKSVRQEHHHQRKDHTLVDVSSVWIQGRIDDLRVFLRVVFKQHKSKPTYCTIVKTSSQSRGDSQMKKSGLVQGYKPRILVSLITEDQCKVILNKVIINKRSYFRFPLVSFPEPNFLIEPSPL